MTWTLDGGYVLSGLSPVLLGALRDLSGGFTVPALVPALFAAERHAASPDGIVAAAPLARGD